MVTNKIRPAELRILLDLYQGRDLIEVDLIALAHLVFLGYVGSYGKNTYNLYWEGTKFIERVSIELEIKPALKQITKDANDKLDSIEDEVLDKILRMELDLYKGSTNGGRRQNIIRDRIPRKHHE